MRAHALAAIVLVAAFAAGCTASGDRPDPWAYTKKPLYAGGFDLGRLAGQEETQQFRVTDGSIGAIRANVWINATAGGALITLHDPSGNVVLETDRTTEAQFPLNLGAWSVTATGHEGSAGIVHVLVTRA